MNRRAYRIQTGVKQYGYRTFPTNREAERYSQVAFRGQTCLIEEIAGYPNSRFINNRPLSIREVHYGN